MWRSGFDGKKTDHTYSDLGCSEYPSFLAGPKINLFFNGSCQSADKN